MKKGMILLIFMVLITGLSIPGYSAVITFDDITSGAASVQIPTNYYSDLTFNSFAFVESDTYYTQVWGNGYNSPSGNYALFNGYGVLSFVIDFYQPVDFTGAEFTGFAQNNGQKINCPGTASSVTLFAYNGDTLVGSTSSGLLPTDSYTPVLGGFSNITKLVIQASPDSLRSYWLMDNFTYNLTNSQQLTSAGTAPVPEPTTMMLFGTGMIGLAGFRKRFKKN